MEGVFRMVASSESSLKSMDKHSVITVIRIKHFIYPSSYKALVEFLVNSL